MEVLAIPAPLFDETAPREQVAGSAYRGQNQARTTGLEVLENLARTPGRVRPADVTDGASDDLIDAMRTGFGGSTLVLETRSALFLEAPQPLVGRLAADAVASAELTDAERSEANVLDEFFPLVPLVTFPSMA